MTDFRCPFCHFQSFHERDAEQRYCSHCHVFVDDVVTASPTLRKVMSNFCRELAGKTPDVAEAELLTRMALVWEHKPIQPVTD